MKQKDIALIIIIGAISAAISFGASQLVFSSPQNRQQTAAVVDPISTEFATPDSKFFNNNSINPAKLIEVGSNTNTNPFNGTGQ